MGDDEIQEEDASSIIAAELEAGLLASIRNNITYNNNNIQGYFNDASAVVQSIIDFVSTVTTKDPTNIHLTIYNRAKEVAAAIPNKIQEYTIPLNADITAAAAAAEAAAINANNTCLTVIAIKNTLTAHKDISIAAIEARNSSNNTMNIANTIDQNKNTTEYNKGLQAATAAATAATVIEGIITSNIVNINNAVNAAAAASLNATNSTDISTASQTAAAAATAATAAAAAAAATAAAVAATKCLMLTRIHVNATTNKYLEVRMIKYALERATTSTTSTTGTTAAATTELNSVPPKSKVELANDVVLAKQAAAAAAAQNVSVKRKIADQAKLIMDMTIEQVNKCKTVTDILLKEYNDRRSGLST